MNQRTLAALHRAKNDEEARTAILSFVAGLHDGHFSQLPSLAPAVKAEDAPPFKYDRQQPEAGCAALGYASEGSTAFSLPFESLQGFLLTADGQEKPLRAGIVTTETNVRLGVIRLGEFAPRLTLPCV